jgi:hypothetical protein
MFALLRRTRRHESNANWTTRIKIQTIKLRLIAFSGNSVNKSIFYLGLFLPHMFTFCPWRLHHAERGGAWPGRPASQRLGAAARGYGGVDPYAGSSANARSAWAGRRRQLPSTAGMAAASAGRARPGRGFGWGLRDAVLLVWRAPWCAGRRRWRMSSSMDDLAGKEKKRLGKR